MRSLSVCRGLLPLLLVLLVTPSLAAAQEPVKIGLIYTFSHRLAHYGFAAKQGAEMAIEDLNRRGGLLGRRVEAVYGDTKLKPDVGAKVAEQLVTDDRVDVVMGIVSSGVAKAVSPVMNELETPLIITLAMTPDVTGVVCNPWTFRVSLNGPQNIRGAAALASEMDVEQWTTMAPDYIFGYQCWEYFQKYLGQIKPDAKFARRVNTVYASVLTTDFVPFIKRLQNTGADGVLCSLYGGNLKDFIRQGNEMKLFDGKIKFLMNLAYSNDVLFSLGLDMPKGVWLSGLYWFQANKSKVNTEFVERYASRFRVFPDYNAHGGYAGVVTYAAAVKKAGTTDKEAVREALEGLTVDLPIGTVLIRAEDHQAVSDGVWGQTADYDPKWRARLLDPMRIFPGQRIVRPVEETGCNRRAASLRKRSSNLAPVTPR